MPECVAVVVHDAVEVVAVHYAVQGLILLVELNLVSILSWYAQSNIISKIQ
jgi:hypothetical protein